MMRNGMKRAVMVAMMLAMVGGCQTTREAYYNAWENFGGYAKRTRLVDNVKAAREEQFAAKEQFATALEQFKSIVNFDGGNLEAMYKKLNSEYERSESQAEEVREKIEGVKRVARVLFDEWRGEIGQIKDDPSLQRSSQQLYDSTKDSYDEMIARMDSAAATMEPVLTRFKNRVLFVKHNLNAQAITSLKGTETELSGDIERLIGEMEASIAEADSFIAQMQPEN